jgi:hypothetical protein
MDMDGVADRDAPSCRLSQAPGHPPGRGSDATDWEPPDPASGRLGSGWTGRPTRELQGSAHRRRFALFRGWGALRDEWLSRSRECEF